MLAAAEVAVFCNISEEQEELDRGRKRRLETIENRIILRRLRRRVATSLQADSEALEVQRQTSETPDSRGSEADSSAGLKTHSASSLSAKASMELGSSSSVDTAGTAGTAGAGGAAVLAKPAKVLGVDDGDEPKESDEAL